MPYLGLMDVTWTNSHPSWTSNSHPTARTRTIAHFEAKGIRFQARLWFFFAEGFLEENSPFTFRCKKLPWQGMKRMDFGTIYCHKSCFKQLAPLNTNSWWSVYDLSTSVHRNDTISLLSHDISNQLRNFVFLIDQKHLFKKAYRALCNFGKAASLESEVCAVVPGRGDMGCIVVLSKGRSSCFQVVAGLAAKHSRSPSQILGRWWESWTCDFQKLWEDLWLNSIKNCQVVGGLLKRKGCLYKLHRRWWKHPDMICFHLKQTFVHFGLPPLRLGKPQNKHFPVAKSAQERCVQKGFQHIPKSEKRSRSGDLSWAIWNSWEL